MHGESRWQSPRQSPGQVPDKVADTNHESPRQVRDFVGNLSWTLLQSRRNGIWALPVIPAVRFLVHTFSQVFPFLTIVWIFFLIPFHAYDYGLYLSLFRAINKIYLIVCFSSQKSGSSSNSRSSLLTNLTARLTRPKKSSNNSRVPPQTGKTNGEGAKQPASGTATSRNAGRPILYFVCVTTLTKVACTYLITLATNLVKQ